MKRFPLASVVALVIAWMIGINTFALISWNRLNLIKDTAYTWIDTHHLHTPSWNPLALPARWDSEWYFSIARDGYTFTNLHSLSNIVFFPVYPALMWLFSFFLGGNLLLTGWLISLAALLAGCIVLARLVHDFHPELDPTDAVWILLLFPTAIFFSAIYTESLFFFLSVLTVYLGRKKFYLWAGVVGGLAALTRVTGVLLFIPLCVEAVLEWRTRRTLNPRTLALLLIPLAGLSFFAFHWFVYGDPTLFFQIERVWGRSFQLNQDHLFAQTSAAQANLALDALFAVFGLGACVWIWKRVRPSYAVYTLAAILVPLSTGTLMSIGRYLLVLFPIHLALATLPSPQKRVWTMFSTLLLALYTLLFAHSYWAG